MGVRVKAGSYPPETDESLRSVDGTAPVGGLHTYGCYPICPLDGSSEAQITVTLVHN